MVDDGEYTAVLDRIEVTQSDVAVAVLLLEPEGEPVDDVALACDRLPEDGQHEDAVFDVTIVDGDLRTIEYDTDATAERSEAAQSRFDRLSDRPPESDGDANG